MRPVRWKVVGVSVAGFSHEAKATPCEDAHAIAIADSGWLIAAVADGAGSAPRSGEGSRAIVDGTVGTIEARLARVSADEQEFLERAARAWLEVAIDEVRRSLAETGAALADFHATLVGVVAGASGGVLFHIGDGAACAARSDDLAASVLSPPENGEYANETFFFTGDDWAERLRLTPFGPEFDLLALMSDGVTPLALCSGATRLYAPFLAPVSRFLRGASREEGERALAATLARDAVRSITDDDKTLVWALRLNADD